MTDRFSDNTAQNRFELEVDGQTAFATYRRTDKGLAILHVEAPMALRGTGAASRLMERVVEAARAENAAVIPYCSYAAAWMRQSKQ